MAITDDISGTINKEQDEAAVGAQIAALLIDVGVLTPEQLSHATRIHSKLKGARTLISILIELQSVDEPRIREALRLRRPALPLGRVLVELGHLKEHDLRLALALQKEQPGLPLGELLYANSFADRTQVLGVLADLNGFVVVDGETAELDVPLLRKASLRICHASMFVPLRRPDGTLVVTFADPLNGNHVAAARHHLGIDFAVGLSSRKSVILALERGERELATPAAVHASDSPTVRAVDQIVRDALAAGASDIHFEPMRDRMRVRFRVDGAMMPHTEFPADAAPSVISRIKVMAGADIAERRRHQDGRILFSTARGAVDIRVSSYVSIHGEKIVMRLLSNRGHLLTIRDIGMAPKMLEYFQCDALDAPSGVVIVTGPTGSGKTTTLYAAVNYLNDAHTSIVTAEDPVEYMIDGVSQCSINPKINLSYEETLKHMMRQDPDVLVIGEIRDQFSAEVAINAALTGHKVLTTFHTEDSIGGLLRLLNMNIEAFLISSTVLSVMAQRLLRRICPHCTEPYVPTPSELRRLGYTPADVMGAHFALGRGCPECRFTGYRGRVCVFELLVLNEIVKEAIVARKTSYEIRRLSTETSGLVTLVEDGVHKAANGLTSLNEVIRGLPRVAKPRGLREIRRILGD